MIWSTKDIPSQAGKLALITGATGGLGYETALELARAGATVVLTGRNAGKGADALKRITAEVPGAKVSYESLDLSALANVARFADDFAAKHDRLDILVNNAGVMAPTTRQETKDGFELQWGTNYLSHFALTAQLLPLLMAAKAPRVVQLSSTAAQIGRIDFDDLDARNSYRPFRSYSQSKLAMLMFARELQKRSDANGWHLHATAAHPGWAMTDLVANGPANADGLQGQIGKFIGTVIGPMMGQSGAQGALPQLFAVTSPDARPGGYYGPDGMMEMRGSPGDAKPPRRAVDAAAAERLWQVSEQLTGRRFPSIAKAA